MEPYMSEDLFLKIIDREIPADIVYETEAPVVIEKKISDRTKQIIVSSDTHYTDIYSYVDIEDTATGRNFLGGMNRAVNLS